jgi:hypothetical protein
MATVAGRSTTATRVTAAEDAERHGHHESDQPLHHTSAS